MDNKICFVIQPFSQPYEKRYETIYKPAIEKAGLTPRRVGRPGDNIITEEIEQGIKNATACLAEITPDFYTMLDVGGKRIFYMHNPNVWYELGFAYSCGKPVSMVCNQEVLPLRNLPFDISTRFVNGYTNAVDSGGQARAQLIQAVGNDLMKKMSQAPKATAAQPTATPHADSMQLTDDAIAALKIIMRHGDESVAAYMLEAELENYIQQKVAFLIDESDARLRVKTAINSLIIERMINKGDDDYGPCYVLTYEGRVWWNENQDKVINT